MLIENVGGCHRCENGQLYESESFSGWWCLLRNLHDTLKE